MGQKARKWVIKVKNAIEYLEADARSTSVLVAMDEDSHSSLSSDEPDDTEDSVLGSDDEGEIRNHIHEITQEFFSDGMLPVSATAIGAKDRLNEAFHRKAALSGELSLHFVHRITDIYKTVRNLTQEELDDIHAFNLKVDTSMKDSVFLKIPRAFPGRIPGQSIYTLQQSILRLSGIKPVIYECCRRSCILFWGPHEELDECPYCKLSRQDDTTDRPRAYFYYLPLIPRLLGMYLNPELALKLKSYRSTLVHQPGIYNDIFDGRNFQDLASRRVVISGQEQSFDYFSDEHDIAFGLSFDGFCPFKHRKQSCWPIMGINYSLPPTDRFKLQHLVPFGVIPGPSQPKDADSFLLPFVEEMIALSAGVKAFDAHSNKKFILRAYCIAAFGDIPAAAKLMKMKGVNALSPCRNCNIRGHRDPHSRSTTNYVSLYRPDKPDYQALALPSRSPREFLEDARAISRCLTKAEAEALSKETGIKGVPVLSMLDSLRFPDSFPADFMHMVFENIVPQLVDLWSDDFKGIGEGEEEYCLPLTVLNAINSAIASSGDTIPSLFGSRVPTLNNRYQFTAEAWCHWSIYLAPVLLKGRFKKDRYYNHFIELVLVIMSCISYAVGDDGVDEIEDKLAKWVLDFEK